MLIQRAKIITSKEIFVTNMLPASMLSILEWNPLLNCIDQALGFKFMNDNSHSNDPFFLSG